MGRTSIEWATHSWNPGVYGCEEISPACANCLDPATPVLMADMSWRPIGSIVAGDEVVGFTESPGLGRNRVYELATVVRSWSTRKESVEVSAGGRSVVASADHRFLARARPWWREAERLTLRSKIVDIGAPALGSDTDSEDYLAGYAAGAIAGDGTFRIDGSGKNGTRQSYMRVAVLTSDLPILKRLQHALLTVGCSSIHIAPFDSGRPGRPMLKVETRRRDNLLIIRDRCSPERDNHDWRSGFLAGLLDTDGGFSARVLRFYQKKQNGVLDATRRHIAALGFSSADDAHSVRLTGDTEEKIRFLTTIRPALARKASDFFGTTFPGTRGTDVDGVRRVGQRDLVDIETTTGTFIANGFAVHNCYAAKMAHRQVAMGNYPEGITVRRASGVHWSGVVQVADAPSTRGLPGRVRGPRPRVFLTSMADLFHRDVPDRFIVQVFDVVRSRPDLDFLVLSKRPERMAGWTWPSNAWAGTTVEDQKRADERIPHLLRVPARIRFLSCEPLLGPVNLRVRDLGAKRWVDCFDDEYGHGRELVDGGIHWVLAGGESGPKARPSHPDWYRSLRDQCDDAGVPFLFKQFGDLLPACQATEDRQRVRPVEFPSPNNPEKRNTYFRPGKAAAGRELDGTLHDEVPR